MTVKMIILIISTLATELPEGTVSQYAGYIKEEAEAYNIDPKIVLAVLYTESRFVTTAYSNHNYGLGGLRYKWYKKYVNTVEDLYKPDINIHLTVMSIAKWKKRHKRCSDRHHFIGHYGGGMKASGRYERSVMWALSKINAIIRHN